MIYIFYYMILYKLYILSNNTNRLYYISENQIVFFRLQAFRIYVYDSRLSPSVL